MRRRVAYYEDLPRDLSDRAWNRRYIEPWDLLRIAAWKSSRTPAFLSLEEPDRIVSITGTVLESLRPYRHAVAAEVLSGSVNERDDFLNATKLAIGPPDGPKGGLGGGLCSLHGIRLRVATAVLATLNPAAWAVVDVWAVQTLFLPPAPQADRLDVYWQYLQRLADLQSGQYAEKTIHEVDLLAMNLGMEGEHPPFDRIPFVVAS